MAPSSKIRGDGAKPCSKCSDVSPISEFYTTGKCKDGSPKYNSWCRGCVKIKMASYHKKTWGLEKLQFSAHKRTKSVQAFMCYLLSKARRRAVCDVTANDLEQMWAAQGGRCAVTGWAMTMVLGKGNIITNVSIDRIDSGGAYTKSNVQLVCRAANVAKSDLSQAVFTQMCIDIARTHFEKTQNTSMAA